MLKDELKQFYGTDHYYSITPNTIMTDGVKYFADKTEAFWLMTDIALNSTMRKELKDEDFIAIKTRKKTDGGIIVQYEDGNYNVLLMEEYPYSDLPDDGQYTFWKEGDIILLPSEH